jgi:outer membrane receptor protein involved in Fe transport
VPNGSRYTSFGAFILDDWAAIDDRLQITGGLRFSYFRAAINAKDNIIGDTPMVPSSEQSYADITFNVGTTIQLSDQATVALRAVSAHQACLI